MAAREPDLAYERELLAAGGALVAMDEVGRGAIAGPVAVGAVFLSAEAAASDPVPVSGVRDSKLLSPSRREALAALIEDCGAGPLGIIGAVGFAEPGEVDTVGIVGALRLAGLRALEGLPESDRILLDGSHDWLSAPAAPDLFSAADDDAPLPPVTMRVKADLTCWSVAAASILAKVRRDAVMTELALAWPGYGFERNKGYGTAEHTAGLAELGLTPAHRASWAIQTTRGAR
ncbi:ribonuclease HII [Falsarthrobacter nasiphocae]|uniref:Ribonuclease n=1 Tax=Falsarthrobacter nasiphocae TaxID=189863 RepID=A0AAE3YIK7_9MICC|nr:ribonuclease HII [Falsarthrobacter nasiphocae]MDR6892865.1 ribonuclease HII [Falsarthrobacter nasiphocae]